MNEHPDSSVQIDLGKVPTCRLVEELQKRDGVQKEYAAPYTDKLIAVNGPAVILIVID